MNKKNFVYVRRVLSPSKMLKHTGLNFLKRTTPIVQQALGLKFFAPPINYEYKEKVERPKLRIMERSPQYPPYLKPSKMQKKLKFMRGPEKIHNELLHKQYGKLLPMAVADYDGDILKYCA